MTLGVVLVDAFEPSLNVWDAPGFCDGLPALLDPQMGERFVLRAALSNGMVGPWVVLSRRPRQGGGVVVTIARPWRVNVAPSAR